MTLLVAIPAKMFVEIVMVILVEETNEHMNEECSKMHRVIVTGPSKTKSHSCWLKPLEFVLKTLLLQSKSPLQHGR